MKLKRMVAWAPAMSGPIDRLSYWCELFNGNGAASLVHLRRVPAREGVYASDARKTGVLILWCAAVWVLLVGWRVGLQQNYHLFYTLARLRMVSTGRQRFGPVSLVVEGSVQRAPDTP